MPSHPDIHVEVSIEHRFIDIVAERFDAGIRLGEAVERDMIAVRIGPELRWVVVGSPGYLADRSVPATPQSLTDHRCVNYRNTAAGDLYAWEFDKDGRELSVRVDGPLAFNDVYPAVDAAIQGLGLAYVPEDIARGPLQEGKLVQVLEDWCQPSPGYYLYYPSRRQMPPAFTVLVNALKWRGGPPS